MENRKAHLLLTKTQRKERAHNLVVSSLLAVLMSFPQSSTLSFEHRASSQLESRRKMASGGLRKALGAFRSGIRPLMTSSCPDQRALSFLPVLRRQ